jgi:predicted alpha/beta-hydrolase family hydrolase
MTSRGAKSFKLDIPQAGAVTAKIDAPAKPSPGSPALVLGHGSNNSLEYPLLAYVAESLVTRLGATVLRFNFPYVERGAEQSSDSADTLLATFRRAYDYLVSEAAPTGAPIFVGGKSLGGRTAAELVSRRPEGDGIEAAGLIELGYPLHPPGRTDRLNVKPLRHIDIPSLFCIGSRDVFCDLGLLRPVLPTLLGPSKLYVVEGGDHSLLLPRSSGKAPDAMYPDVLDRLVAFMSLSAPAGAR